MIEAAKCMNGCEPMSLVLPKPEGALAAALLAPPAPPVLLVELPTPTLGIHSFSMATCTMFLAMVLKRDTNGSVDGTGICIAKHFQKMKRYANQKPD